MSCDQLDKDQMFIVQDYGPDGYVGIANLNLQHGLRPGAVITVVYRASDWMEININDINGDFLIHIVYRVDKNEFIINSRLNGVFTEEDVIKPVPVPKGIRTVTTLVYEEQGYRLFINGKEITFYKHRSQNMPHLLSVPHSVQIYKIIYHTTRIIIP